MCVYVYVRYVLVCILTSGWLGAYYEFLLTSFSLSPTLSFPLCASFILYLSVSGRPEECLMQAPALLLLCTENEKKKDRKRESSRLDHRNVNTSGAKITLLS